MPSVLWSALHGVGGVRRLGCRVLPGSARRRQTLAALACLAVVAACGNLPKLAKPPARPGPNLLLIVADDLGWGDVGFHGSGIETPRIDQLAAEGLELHRFYVNPVCTPTRAALLTGRSPMSLGLLYSGISRMRVDAGLARDEYTIAEYFRAAGYSTALVGKWHLGAVRSEYLPNPQGFELFYGQLGGLTDYYSHRFGKVLDWQENGVPLEVEGYATDLLGERAIRFLRERDPARPFLLVLSYTAPHWPYNAPSAELVAKYRQLGLPHPRNQYASVVEAMDASIGQVLDVLRKQAIAENTIVVFLSDNGAAMAHQAGRNRPFRGGKLSVMEGGIRVPAVIRWPSRLPAGARSEQRRRDVDLLPTLAAAAGLEPPSGSLDGRNLWPTLVSGDEIPRRPFLFAADNLRATGTSFAALGDRWKLVVREGPDGQRMELYNLSRDPWERFDVSRKHPKVVERLNAEIERWKASHPRDGLRWNEREKALAHAEAGADWSSMTEVLRDPENLRTHLEDPERYLQRPPER